MPKFIAQVTRTYFYGCVLEAPDKSTAKHMLEHDGCLDDAADCDKELIFFEDIVDKIKEIEKSKDSHDAIIEACAENYDDDRK